MMRQDPRGRRFSLRLAVLAAIAGALLVSAGVVLAAGHRSESGVYWFSDASQVEGASASLVRTPNGVSMNVTTMDLDPGAAYTAWWVIFNNPAECTAGIAELTTCGEPDLFVPEVGAAVLFATGNVAGMSGRAGFAAGLQVGDLSGCQEPFDGFGLCGDGLTNPAGAEIHLVIRSHEDVIPAIMPTMIHSFAGGCTPASSLGAGDGPNECEDQQFAPFLP